MFKGVYTALITPFHNGRVDEKIFAEFVEWQIQQGVTGLVPCGTTGESLFLDSQEQKRLVEIAVDVSHGRATVIAGTAALTTEGTIALTQQAKKAGADGALIVNPWYIKPSQESLYQHYKAVHDAVDLPIIIYNNPSRTGVEISIDVLKRFKELPNICGIKDSSSNLLRATSLRNIMGSDFSLLAGNDDTMAGYLAMGGDGAISVASNVLPQLFARFYHAWEEQDIKLFEIIRDQLYPFIEALSTDSNPHPVKYATSLVKQIPLESRLPFAPLGAEAMEAIKKTLNDLENYHLIKTLNKMAV